MVVRSGRTRTVQKLSFDVSFSLAVRTSVVIFLQVYLEQKELKWTDDAIVLTGR